MNPPKFCAHGPFGVANVESIVRMVESGTKGQLWLFTRQPIRSPDVENVCWGLTGLIITALVVAEMIDRVTGRRK